MGLKNKGVFFSIDALIALIIIIGVILLAYPYLKEAKHPTNLHQDIISTLSSIKIGEINTSFARSLISQGMIVDLNKSLLEQIGEFYAINTTLAKLLASDALSTLDTTENVGVWYGNTLILSKNKTSFEEARNVETARQIISGVKEGGSATGYSARAFLSSSLQNKYFYLGGYVGDGNITTIIEYNGTINDASLEIAIKNDFELYVNQQSQGTYTKSPSLTTPAIYNLPINNFHNGTNYIEFKGTNISTAGGFIKITYRPDPEYEKPTRKYLPGIKGVLNIYDGLNIPGDLSTLNVFLHYNTTNNMFLVIGNKTVFATNSTGETTTTITNNQLQSLIDYDAISDITTPLRLGIENISLLQGNGSGSADVILITDLSISMNNTLASDSEIGVRRDCTDPDLFSDNTARISLVKCLDKEFTDIILNATGNRVALVGFFGDSGSPLKGRVNRTSNFISDKTMASNIIEQYGGVVGYDGTPHFPPSGGGCVCCALNSAFKLLKDGSNITRKQFVIVMSDGLPIYTCGTGSSGATGTATGYPNNDASPTASASCSTGQGAVSEAIAGACTGAISSNPCSDSINNANWSSCRVAGRIPGSTNQGTNATVYSVGFGPVDQCEWANTTLNNIASCGNGKYYSSKNASELKDIYRQIAEQIVELSFQEQAVFVSANVSATLYPDSYIEYEYNKTQIPYGLLITVEKQFTDSAEGSFSIPEKSTFVNADVVSYSGSRWTNIVQLNGNYVYRLSDYGFEYIKLGDHYFIGLPKSFVLSNASNTVYVNTGLAPTNVSTGSSSNKIIFSVVKNVSGYSPVVAQASGCIWTIEFEDNSNITVASPYGYTGSEVCSFTSASHTKDIAYNSNDAFQVATFNILKSLDFNGNYKVDVPFTEQDLQISVTQTTGIPYTWSTEVQVRIWN